MLVDQVSLVEQQQRTNPGVLGGHQITVDQVGVRLGQVLEFVAEPSVADDALPAILAAIEEGLGEDVEPLPAVSEAAPAVADIAQVISAPAAGSVIHAIAAAPGIAVGPAPRGRQSSR